jgi:hypothetical protein
MHRSILTVLYDGFNLGGFMPTERLVKWSKEAKEFFEKAEDNSIVLDLVISCGCASQSGLGFEDLVNSINSEILRKIKKVNITDTTYLYRHCVPEFDRYCEKDITTLWYLSNRGAIEKLSVPVELKSWAEDIKKDEFKIWYNQIMKDFDWRDTSGVGVWKRTFREQVIADASVSASKGNGTFQQCIDFILEESAHMCAFLQNAVVAYPMEFLSSCNILIEHYKVNLKHLNYKISSYSRKKNDNIKNLKLERDVLPFLGKFLNANFFVIDSIGNYIYKNNKLTQIVGDMSANVIDAQAWEKLFDCKSTFINRR